MWPLFSYGGNFFCNILPFPKKIRHSRPQHSPQGIHEEQNGLVYLFDTWHRMFAALCWVHNWPVQALEQYKVCLSKQEGIKYRTLLSFQRWVSNSFRNWEPESPHHNPDWQYDHVWGEADGRGTHWGSSVQMLWVWKVEVYWGQMDLRARIIS